MPISLPKSKSKDLVINLFPIQNQIQNENNQNIKNLKKIIIYEDCDSHQEHNIKLEFTTHHLFLKYSHLEIIDYLNKNNLISKLSSEQINYFYSHFHFIDGFQSSNYQA